MPIQHLGTINAVAVFSSAKKENELVSNLRVLEEEYDDGEYALSGSLSDMFASLCDLRLQELKRLTGRMVHSLKAETGAGWAEYANGHYVLVCELVVDTADLDTAKDILLDDEIAERFEDNLSIAARTFVRENFPKTLISGVHASFIVEA